MRRISANYIFPVQTPPLRNGIIILSDSGEIIDIIDTKGNLKEIADLEFYNGIIVPGFVNTHCHLELSYLKGQFEQHTGMAGFISQIMGKRDQPDKTNINIIEQANDEMRSNGIVAVADISNADTSFLTKLKSNIKYNTFIEVFDLDEKNAETAFSSGMDLLAYARNMGLKANIVPHTPHTVSIKLLKLIVKNIQCSDDIFCIHNQESADENEFFISGNGSIRDLFANYGINTQHHKVSGKSSLQSVIEHYPANNTSIFVHNTFTQKDDIKIATSLIPDLYWVVCPKSNLFIENKLPDLYLFYNEDIAITLGTDSYASNTSLSILEEMKIITEKFPKIPFTSIVKWGTLNGAKALKIENEIGSFEKGKHPGVNLITGFDFENQRLTSESKVKVLA